MPKYLMRGRYTPAGLAGAVNEGFASREQYITQLAQLLDSEVEAVYWGVGDEQFFILLDTPDAIAAAARTLTTNVTGATSSDHHAGLHLRGDGRRAQPDARLPRPGRLAA